MTYPRTHRKTNLNLIIFYAAERMIQEFYKKQKQTPTKLHHIEDLLEKTALSIRTRLKMLNEAQETLGGNPEVDEMIADQRQKL